MFRLFHRLFTLRLAFAFFFWHSFLVEVLANENQPSNSTEYVFLLNQNKLPSKIIDFTQSQKQKSELVMKMPSNDNSLNQIGRHLDDHAIRVEHSNKANRSKLSDSRPPSVVRLSTSKIQGTLRLPRLKFARAAIPMELREEMPSLDFTQKSLKDGDF